MNTSQSKKHACEWSGCEKSFSRSDHLQRHRLNHSSRGSTCQRCRAHFKRPDLLDRHMARHKQRDLEAGGDGMGVVETRKRLWEDTNGNVVQNRPSTPPPSDRCRKRRRTQLRKERPQQYQEAPNDPIISQTIELQPTLPTSDTLSHAHLEEHATVPGSFDHADPNVLDLWGLPSPPGSIASIELGQSTGFESGFESLNRPQDAYSSMSETTSCDSFTTTVAPSDIYLASGGSDSAISLVDTPTSDTMTWSTSPPTDCNTIYQSMLVESTFQDLHSLPLETVYASSPSRNMPSLDEVSRERVLQTIFEAGARHAHGTAITEYTPFLSLPALQAYSNFFFSDFNDKMPIIHRSTFQPSAADPLLLLAMLLLGSSALGEATSELALCIYNALPAVILQQHVTSKRSHLQRMQTLLLLETFGRLKGNRRQQGVARVYHTLLVQLLERHNSQNGEISPFATDDQIDLQWRAEMESEERKRLAYFCFIADTQWAMLLSEATSMSASQLCLSLPCDPAAWEAESAEQWCLCAS